MDAPTATIAEGWVNATFALNPAGTPTSFAGITLDPTLSERIAFADFTWGAMSHGEMVMPREGIAAVPKQLAARLRSTDIRLNISVRGHGIQRCGQRSSETFDRVVLAVPQHVAGRMLPNLSANTNPLSD